MARAILLAEEGRGFVHPNPLVGAIVVHEGRVLAEGWHARFGGAHAEVDALSKLGGRAPGATIYVTLEPCCHEGKTPPCTKALIGAGIGRVVYGAGDPNPLVAGRGAAELREAGIEVLGGVLEAECRALNEPFFHFHTTGRPFVTVKAAMTLDGKIADRDGRSRWISSSESRRAVHALRREVDAVVIGRRTAELDDPSLTVRDVPGRNPVRVVLDGEGKLPASLAMFRDGAARTICVTTAGAPAAGGERWEIAPDPSGRPDVAELLARAAREGWQHILVEGGATLVASFLREGFVDRLVLFVAPKVLGSPEAPAWVGDLGTPGLDRARPFALRHAECIGSDVLLVLVPKKVVDGSGRSSEGGTSCSPD